MNINAISLKQATALVLCSFVLRTLVMLFFVQPNMYYKQADSRDYHNCALGISLGTGMHRIDTKDPIFWRTPGYPWYLSFFYSWCGLKSAEFEKNSAAQSMALWVQIFLASFIPLILFYLGYICTHNIWISHALAWISVIHPGLVLASSFFLTEGLALIFFFLFLLFFFKLIFPQKDQKNWIDLLVAVGSLSIYTWMRPMGEFVGYFSALFLFFASVGSLKKRLFQTFLFGTLFFATLFPWYYRNYQLTNEWFFCPTIGTYLNVFNAPKILRRTTGKPLTECHKILGRQAGLAVMKERKKLAGTGLHVSNNACKSVSMPICINHPWYFIYDWIVECLKTTFDLYSYQLVAMANDSYWYDPIEEYLPDKIADCLWKERIPIASRVISWLEFISAILIWIGAAGSFWLYVIRCKKYGTQFVKLWLLSIAMGGLCIGMTGGFGYARLRLPVEPLLLILSLIFWHWLLYTKKDLHEK